MKTLLLTLCIGIATVAQADPLARGGVWLNAREQTDFAKQFYSYDTDWGSFIVKRWGSRELAVKMRRTIDGNPTVGFETIFLTGFSPKYGIVEHRRRVMELPLGRDVEFSVLCGYEHVQTKLVKIGVYDFHGTRKPTGWAIRIWSEGKVIAQHASLPEILIWLEKANLPTPKK